MREKHITNFNTYSTMETKYNYLYQDSKPARMRFEIAKHLIDKYKRKYSVTERDMILGDHRVRTFIVHRGRYYRSNSKRLVTIVIIPDVSEQGYFYYKFPYINKEDKRHIVGNDYSDVLNYIDGVLTNL